jgi:regulator of sigma E protease
MFESFMSGLSAISGGFLGYLIPFLFVLTIVVFFHELGHFWVARLCGIRVMVFSIGFGPELFGFNDRHGTRWKVAAIPLGGYVKFFGDESAASTPDANAVARMNPDERKVSFFHQPVRNRAAVVVAGPLANFILAIAIFAGIFAIYGKPSTAARVDSVQENSAAAAAGFRAGDIVTKIDGRTIDSFSDMQRVVSTSAGKRLEIQVERNGSPLILAATPELREVKDNFGNIHRMAAEEQHTQPVNPVTAVWLGAQETWFVVDRTISYLAGIVAGREAADQLGGPIRIAQVSGQVATVGLTALLHLAAVLSVSIGLLNLFPVPLLDGGHLMFYGIEALRGRPLSERAQEYSFRIGLALVGMLMIFATYNDLRNLAPS